MVKIGSGAFRQLSNLKLSRYACYLIVQNGDPSKPVIANGQTYFDIQTRRQEITEVESKNGFTKSAQKLAKQKGVSLRKKGRKV